MPIVIFNALNWKRSEVIKYPLDPTDPRLLGEVGDLDAWCVFDADGKLLPSQSSAEHILFLAADLPSVGYRLFWLTPHRFGEDLIPHPSPPLIKGRGQENPPFIRGVGGVTPSPQQSASTETLGFSDFIFKNQFVAVKINSETGDIDSIYDLVNHRETISPGANQLQAFQDGGQYWDAWNIDPKYAEKPLPPSQLKSIEWIENGAIRQRLRVVRELAGSEFCQDYSLDAHSSIVRIETSVDWQAEHVLIKANFPLNLTADLSTSETACGAIIRRIGCANDRTTTPETPAEQAKWELPMHRWADLTDNSGADGVSLLNDCKYGYDAGTDYLRLTLLRSSNWPDPTADKGYHEFTYAIYPHNGTWQAAQTVRKGLELNSPLQVFQLAPQPKIAGTKDLAPINSLIDLQAENLVLMAFKPSDSLAQAWVLRCYECHGVAGKIELTGSLDLQIDRVVNLLEQPQSELVDTIVQPWQIRSFGIK